MHLKKRKTVSKKLTVAVGAPGFEPGTSCTPCKHASRTALRPEQQALIILKPRGKCKLFLPPLLPPAFPFFHALPCSIYFSPGLFFVFLLLPRKLFLLCLAQACKN